MADKPMEVIKEEVTRQIIILAFSVAGAAIAIIAARVSTDETYRSTLKMQAALEVKHFCQRQSDRWQCWANKAATIYNREKAW